MALRQRIDKAWSNIDVVLKQRHDQLPALVDAVRGLLAFERDVLTEVTAARAAYAPTEPIPAQAGISHRTTAAVRTLLLDGRALSRGQVRGKRRRPPGGDRASRGDDRGPPRALQRPGLSIQHADQPGRRRTRSRRSSAGGRATSSPPDPRPRSRRTPPVARRADSVTAACRRAGPGAPGLAGPPWRDRVGAAPAPHRADGHAPHRASGGSRGWRSGRRLAGRRFALVLSSPLQRATETARLAGFGDAVVLDPDLPEWDYGDLEGRKTVDIRDGPSRLVDLEPGRGRAARPPTMCAAGGPGAGALPGSGRSTATC